MTRTLNLVTLMLEAPVCAVEEDGKILHAVTMEGLTKGWPDGPLSSACGVVVKLLPYPLESHRPVAFPPRLKGLPAHWARCPLCFVATGRKRPRSEFVPRDMVGGVR